MKSCAGVRVRILEEKNLNGKGYNANTDIEVEGDPADIAHSLIKCANSPFLLLHA